VARSRGRAPATHGVYAIEDAGLLLPEAVALDTSFVVHALIESQSLHGPCSTFLERLVAEEVTLVVSELLEIELAEVTFRIALAERWGRAWRRHRTDGRVRRRGRRLLDDVHARYRLLLDAVTEAPIPLAPVAGSAARLMTDYGVASYDAVHTATAIAGGAEAIVTTDTGFGVLPPSLLAIYTDRGDVTACRALRPKR
jgi:predicted nucleic acid-binding protein